MSKANVVPRERATAGTQHMRSNHVSRHQQATDQLIMVSQHDQGAPTVNKCRMCAACTVTPAPPTVLPAHPARLPTAYLTSAGAPACCGPGSGPSVHTPHPACAPSVQRSHLHTQCSRPTNHWHAKLASRQVHRLWCLVYCQQGDFPLSLSLKIHATNNKSGLLSPWL